MKNKKQNLRGVGGWVGRDEKEDKNKRKRMLKCGVGLEKKIKKGCHQAMRLGMREERGERWGRNNEWQFRNIKCCINKNGVENNN